MPTPEVIKKIAREYAKAMCPIDSDYYDYAKEMLEWLSKDYCIVPKEVIYEVNKAVQRAFQDGDKVSEYGWKRIQNWLFGELFNEEKE